MTPIPEMTLAECLEALDSLEEFTLLKDIDTQNFEPTYESMKQNAKELADRIHSLTRWIPVTESLPNGGETVLVKGICNSELYGARAQPEIGLVSWGGVDEFDESYCKDTCYYTVWYTNITHWRRIDTP